jgi:N-acetylglucosamine-6-phosphate deacetylase
VTVLGAAGLACAAGAERGSWDRPGWLRIDGDRIVEVGTGAPPPGATDLGDAVLAPGFVDLQVNGVGGVDFASATPGEIGGALARLAARGCTACLPALVTAPLESYEPALARLAAARAAADAAETGGDPPRAATVGVHLEGPFLGAARGAHPAGLIRPADAGWITDLCDRFDDLVALVTLAPEADPGLAVTRALAGRFVVVALGHSVAAYEDARAAADAGASMVTHVFNGMGPLHHRAPGLAGAALDDPRLRPSVIADLVHVHPAVLRLVCTVRPDAVLVTDAVAVDAGKVGPVSVELRDGAPRLADGTLAGSTLTLDRAVRNVVALGIAPEQAIAMASANPARALGLADRGRLAVGARADLVALDRESLTVRSVWIGGRLVEPEQPGGASGDR